MWLVIGFIHARIMGDNEEDRGILCQKRMLKWVVEHVGRLRFCRAGCRYHIRENKRVCGNLTANKDWQRQDEREGMRRTCLSALHFVKSALAAHKCAHVYAHCRVFYFSQVLFSSLRESDSGQVTTPESHHPWSPTQTKQHCRIPSWPCSCCASCYCYTKHILYYLEDMSSV